MKCNKILRVLINEIKKKVTDFATFLDPSMYKSYEKVEGGEFIQCMDN